MSNQEEKTVFSALIKEIMAILKLDDAGRLEKFFKNEVKLLKSEIKIIETNKQTSALQYDIALSEIDDKIEDAEEALKDAYRNVKIEDINNNDAMKEFSSKYWANIDNKENNLEALKEERKSIVKNYEDHLEARNKKIAKREARIKAIS